MQQWVEAQADKAPEWLMEQQVDGFLVQQPVYDFAAQARQLLGAWQLQSLVQRYRQQLARGSFQLKSIYYSSNPDLAMQQQALLLALDTLPQPIWMREAQALASQNIYLPDNHLLFHLLLRTGNRRSIACRGGGRQIRMRCVHSLPSTASITAVLPAIC